MSNNNLDLNRVGEIIPGGARHDCQGFRCICQRYENGDFAAAIFGRNHLNNQEDNNYENVPRLRNRPPLVNVNPNYQNPIDLIRHYDNNRPRPRRQDQDIEENIYERLDEDEDDAEEHENVELVMPQNNNVNRNNDHTYERISQSHYYYDRPRQFRTFDIVGRLGRNCFSSDNIACVSSFPTFVKSIYNSNNYCGRQHYVCHRCCHNNRSRYFIDPRNYQTYQPSRNCNCLFCRRQFSAYVKLHLAESSKRKDYQQYRQHRNFINCHFCAKKLSQRTSTINRNVDWVESGLDNPLYATIRISRINNLIDTNAPSTSNGSSSSASVCQLNRHLPKRRRHTCDDSCIRNSSGNAVAMCERGADCNRGRLHFVHWWFLNKWLPSWNSIYSERNLDTIAPVVEEPQESDNDDC